MYENLMEQVVAPENCRTALEAVVCNQWPPGIDRMPVRNWKAMAANGSVHKALSNATLRRYGFLMPSDLAGEPSR